MEIVIANIPGNKSRKIVDDGREERETWKGEIIFLIIQIMNNLATIVDS